MACGSSKNMGERSRQINHGDIISRSCYTANGRYLRISAQTRKSKQCIGLISDDIFLLAFRPRRIHCCTTQVRYIACQFTLVNLSYSINVGFTMVNRSRLGWRLNLSKKKKTPSWNVQPFFKLLVRKLEKKMRTCMRSYSITEHFTKGKTPTAIYRFERI